MEEEWTRIVSVRPIGRQLPVVAVVDHVRAPGRRDEDFAVVSGTVEAVARTRAQDRLGESLLHQAAGSIREIICEASRAPHHDGVGSVVVFARTREEVPPLPAPVEVRALEHAAAVRMRLRVTVAQPRHVHVLRAGRERTAVRRQLHAVDLPHGAEEEPYLARLGIDHGLGVDRVADARDASVGHDHAVRERSFRTVARVDRDGRVLRPLPI